MDMVMTMSLCKKNIFKDTPQVCRGKRTECLRFASK